MPAERLSMRTQGARCARLLRLKDCPPSDQIIERYGKIRPKFRKIDRKISAAHSSDRGHLFHAIVSACSRASWAAVP
jgi:hypothetical protein